MSFLVVGSEFNEKSEYAPVAAVTESSGTVPLEGEELEVSVRLIDEGALVRWARDVEDDTGCTLRWYLDQGAPRLLATLRTHEDYALGESTYARRYVSTTALLSRPPPAASRGALMCYLYQR